MSSQRRPTLPFSLSHANIDRHDEAHNLLHHTMMGDGKLAAGPHAAAARATPWATLGHSNCGAMRRSTSESIVPSEPLSGARIQQRRYIRHRSLVRRFTCACRVPCAFLTSTRSLTDQILFRMRTFLATRLCTRGQRSENAQQLWQHGDEILAQLHRDQRREGRSKLREEHHESTQVFGGLDSAIIKTPMIDAIRQEHRSSHGGSRAALLVPRGQPLLIDAAEREMKTLSKVLQDAAQVRAEAQHATQMVARDFERDFKPASSLRHAASLIVLKCTEIRFAETS